MESLTSKNGAGSGRVARKGSANLRRNRSQEQWHDGYSSSDNELEVDLQTPFASRGPVKNLHHEYEDPRNVVTSRTDSTRNHKPRMGTALAGGSNGTPNGHASYNSMEMLSGGRYGPGANLSGSDGESVADARNYSQAPPQYPGYGSLPRAGGTGKSGSMHTSTQRNGAPNGGQRNHHGRQPHGGNRLRRGPSSSSTSDNNSESTFGTDTDALHPSSRRILGNQSRDSTLRESPPDPAPPAVPPRNPYDDTLRGRLGFLDGDEAITTDYLSGIVGHYATPDEDALRNSTGRNNRNNESERVYCQPQNILPTSSPESNKDKDCSDATDRLKGTLHPQNNHNSTYSNTIPVYCSTPCSTTGPMVPVPNCVNPQLIQQSINAAAAAEMQRENSRRTNSSGNPLSAMLASAAMATSRMHLRKACGGHRCSWRTSTMILLFVSVILACTLAYFGASTAHWADNTAVPPGGCILVGGVADETAQRHPPCGEAASVKGNPMATQISGCALLPKESDQYEDVKVGVETTHTISGHDSWNIRFDQSASNFMRFNITTPLRAKLLILARRNEPPALTAYDIQEIIVPSPSDFIRRKKRVSLEELEFMHYLEVGMWFISIINDDFMETTMAFYPNSANVPAACPNNCNGRGTCNHGKCQCFPGHIGADCADSVCPVLCTGHGRYVQGTCRCDPGYKGVDCSTLETECEVPDCSGRGRCVKGKCHCKAGYSGPACDNLDCIDSSCGGHGVCANGQCICKVGWRGMNCSEPDDRLSRCFPDCSQHGVFDLDTERCVCFDHWSGSDCSKAKCGLDCGPFGRCEEGKCHCDPGWTGAKCDLRECDARCSRHGQCNNGTCVCIQGWMGKHCSLEGCPNGCSNHGQCVRDPISEMWSCRCNPEWTGRQCNVPQETQCKDEIDNDGDGLVDCADSECCHTRECEESLHCLASPEPQDILLIKPPPSVTANFYQKMKFLIEEDSVQSYSHKDEYSESQFWKAFVKSRVSVIRGRVVSKQNNGLRGFRVSVSNDPQFGFTLTRQDGSFDILVNGGGAVTLQFQRNPFHPIKRTIMVPWNDLVVMGPVVITPEGSTDDRVAEQEPCELHDYDRMKPIVYQTWRPGSQGGCTEKSAILAETQVIQETLEIPGSDMRLVYQSSHGQGYLSTIHLQLSPSTIPKELKIIHLKVIVEGILFEKIFEADPDIKYTFAWNKRNVYKQKVYGLTTALVHVGYEYRGCRRVIWITETTTLRGYDMDISELGQWNLDIHHRYNFHEGVLQKGDGSTIYFKHQPRVVKPLLGTGKQRPLLCPECTGVAKDNRLLAPVALTSGPDGSIYVGDLNLIRRVTPDGQVYTVFRMKTTDISYQYHITLSPTDGHLYISDPERHQILRVTSLDKGDNPDSNFDVVVGSGERCIPRDKDNCGDGRPALEARLSYPKGLAVSVDNTLYFGDGSNIRMVDSRGIIHTLIGDHHHKRQWRPIPCSGTLKIDEAKLRWPTELAINPLDNTLYFIDDHMILKLTRDKRLMVKAGQPAYCKDKNNSSHPKARVTSGKDLGTLISFAFGPTGTMYIAEVDNTDAYRVRALLSNGELIHFAGRSNCLKTCPPNSPNCTGCGNERNNLAVETRLHAISSLTVSSEGVVHMADLGALKILSAVPYLPELKGDQEYHIAYPDNQEMYIFNKYGQHIQTRNILTGKTKYTFLYNVNTSLGKLSAVTDASGNKVSFLRDSSNNLYSIETARGLKCLVHVTKNQLLESFTDPNNLQTNFNYDQTTKLLINRYDATGKTFFYIYDQNGRLTEIVKPSGQITSLTFDLSEKGASVVAQESGDHSTDVVTVRGPTVITKNAGISLETTVHQDGAIEITSPWRMTAIWDTGTHKVLQELLPVQAGMFPIAVKQSVFNDLQLSNVIEWKYDVKLGKNQVDQQTVNAVERTLVVNGTQFLSTEYDWITTREMLYNSSRRPFLIIQYDGSARPVQYLPTDTRLPMNFQYDRFGRSSGWQQGGMSEQFNYDRSGQLTEVVLANKASVKYTYTAQNKPANTTMPSGRTYQMHYDANGGLQYIVTPKGTKHTFMILISIGFYKLYYTPAGNGGPLTIHYDDRGLPLLKIYPGDNGRILYRYNNQSLLTNIVYGGGKVEYNYTINGFVRSELWAESDVQVKYEYYYEGALLTQCVAKFHSKFQLTTAHFHYQYDDWFRPKHLTARVGTLQYQDVEFSHSLKTGKREQVGSFRFFEITPNDTFIADGTATFTQLLDSQHRIQQRAMLIGDKEVYRMDIQYGQQNNIIQTKTLMRLAGGVQIRTQNFSYDNDAQLTEMVGKDHWKFSYDDNGNIVTMQYMGNKIEILHDVGDRILRFGETPFVVDSRGFVVQRGEERFQYNTKGQLVKAYKPRRGQYEVRYFYDARNRLAMRKDHFGNMTQFFYTDIRKPTLVTHIYNNADGRSMSLTYDDNDFLIHILVNKDNFYVATDHNGSPTLVFDRFGEVVKEVYRGPYGHIIYDSTPTFYLPVDFQGGIFDPLTGVIHFGEKIYDSLTGKWMMPQWDEVLEHVTDTRFLHLYQFNRNDPVNIAGKYLHNRQAIEDWISHQGIDIRTLGLGNPNIVGLRAPTRRPPQTDKFSLLPLPTVPLISGYGCTVKRRLGSFAKLTSVDLPSRAKDTILPETTKAKLSTINAPFGKGIVLSNVGGRAVIRTVDKADSIQRDVYTSVLNNSFLMDLHLVMHGLDVFYLVKDNTWRFNDDTTQLQRLGSTINITIHRPNGKNNEEHHDIRIHTQYAIVNIRYGTTVQKEQNRLLRHAKKHAVSQRWAQERETLLADQQGTLEWNEKEKENVIRTGSAPGYRGDYYHDISKYPELADDPSNVIFVRSLSQNTDAS